MTNIKTRITLALAAIALLGTVGYATTIAVVRADEESAHPFVQALAERLGLNEEEVEVALDEIKADHFAQMQESKEDWLNQAVEDGVLTEEQKQALQEKYQEMWTERKQEWELHREEMDAWFTEQGIDYEALMQYGGFGHRLGEHSGSESHKGMMKHGFGFNNTQ